MVITQYRARTPIFTSRGEFRSPYDSRVYFWRDRWYNVFRLSKPRNDLSLWYCNVTTPLTVQPGQLSYVDLDSDEEVSNQRSRVTDRVSGGLSTAARTRVIMGCWSLSRLVSTCLEEL
jgi:protein associated with RNAse G/E